MEVDKEDVYVEQKVAGNVQEQISPLKRTEATQEQSIRETGNIESLREEYIRSGSIISPIDQYRNTEI